MSSVDEFVQTIAIPNVLLKKLIERLVSKGLLSSSDMAELHAAMIAHVAEIENAGEAEKAKEILDGLWADLPPSAHQSRSLKEANEHQES